MADIIFAPYFTKNIKYNQHDSSNGGKGGSKPDDYIQMRKWYDSVVKYKLEARIFHNELSPEFISKYQTDKIKFVLWDKVHRPSYNDERFFAYTDYLMNNKDIEYVLCTDLYDVEFFGNPFDLMRVNPFYDIFSGSETPSTYSIKWMQRKCKEMNFKMREGEKDTLYNAGIVGGKRDDIITLFSLMIREMKAIADKYNANMPVYNHCVRMIPASQVYTGFPLHNVFNTNKVESGTYIKHK